jgi:hypothetical protein
MIQRIPVLMGMELLLVTGSGWAGTGMLGAPAPRMMVFSRDARFLGAKNPIELLGCRSPGAVPLRERLAHGRAGYMRGVAHPERCRRGSAGPSIIRPGALGNRCPETRAWTWQTEKSLSYSILTAPTQPAFGPFQEPTLLPTNGPLSR